MTMNAIAPALRSAIDHELAAVIDRLLAAASAEAEAAVAAVRADDNRALAAATADLQTQTRRVDALTESSLQLEIQLETLRGSSRPPPPRRRPCASSWPRIPSRSFASCAPSSKQHMSTVRIS